MSEIDNVSGLPYKTYSEVPWYRKNWFALICGLFFGPGLFPSLATGNFYYVRNGELKAYSKVARYLLLAWSALTVVFLASSIFNVSILDSKAVKLVKSGSMQLCGGVTVEKMVDGFMGSPSWESGTSENGLTFVNIGGDISLHDKKVRAVLQFSVNEKEGTFEYRAFEANGVPQPHIMAIGLLKKMCESAVASSSVQSPSATIPEAASLKNSDSGVASSDSNDAKTSRFGKLSIKENALFFKDRPVSPSLKGNAGLSIEGVYQLVDRDVALVMDIGGTACPAQYYIVSLEDSGAQVSKSFGTCSDLAKVYTMSAGISVTMPAYSNDPGDSERRTVLYVYKDGVVYEDGIPVK